MKSIISYENKHLIWQDEIKDTFLILKHCEIYKYSNSTLRVISWSPSFATRIKKYIVIFNYFKTDDNLYVFDTKIENLPVIIDRDRFKRRPNKNGKFIKSLQEKLGHKIISFNLSHKKLKESKYIKNLKK